MQTSSKVVIYAEDYCPYCQKVKKLFTDINVPFEYLDRSKNLEAFTKLSAQYKHTTIPMVFINDKFIGGCSDVETLQKSGKLTELLKA